LKLLIISWSKGGWMWQDIFLVSLLNALLKPCFVMSASILCLPSSDAKIPIMHIFQSLKRNCGTSSLGGGALRFHDSLWMTDFLRIGLL